MPVTVEEGETRYVVRLEGDADIACSMELQQALIQAGSSRKELRLDLALATGVDLTAIQLLWAAAHAAKKRGIPFSIIGQVPESISGALRDAGFENFLTSAAQADSPA